MYYFNVSIRLVSKPIMFLYLNTHTLYCKYLTKNILKILISHHFIPMTKVMGFHNAVFVILLISYFLRISDPALPR